MTHNKQIIALPQNLTAELQREIEAAYKNSLKEMMVGIDARPPQIKIAAGGANNWLLGQDQVAMKTFKGIILANTKANAYWHQEDTTSNPVLIDLPEEHNYNIPICTSLDGITGSRPAQDAAADGQSVSCFGKCANCHLNKFGTAVNDSGERGKGKACKNGRRLIVWVDGYDIPFLLTLPPSSITSFDSYITDLRGMSKPTWAVWTIFELDAKEQGKQRWSIFKPGKPEWVDLEDIAEVYAIHKQFKTIVEISITDDDFQKTPIDDAEFSFED